MHNFKKVLKTFLVLVVCVALLAALDLALYPCVAIILLFYRGYIP
mgnify:CR=1 FL=1